MKPRPFLLAAGLMVVTATTCPAQPASGRHGVQATVRFSHTLDSSFEKMVVGEFSVTSVELGVRGSSSISPATQLLVGLNAVQHDLEFTGPAVLPSRLVAIACPVGLMHRSSDAWRWTATVQPRYAGAPRLGNGGFDMPLMAFATYSACPELTGSFGLRYSRRSSVELLPIIGANWKFAPEWEAKLAFPETGVFCHLSAALTLGGIIELHGGDFRVGQDFPAVGRRTAGSWLEYREVRAGVSGQYEFSRGVSLRADVGYAFSQRFEYQRPDITIEGRGSPYVAMGLVARF